MGGCEIRSVSMKLMDYPGELAQKSPSKICISQKLRLISQVSPFQIFGHAILESPLLLARVGMCCTSGHNISLLSSVLHLSLKFTLHHSNTRVNHCFNGRLSLCHCAKDPVLNNYVLKLFGLHEETLIFNLRNECSSLI